MRIYFDASDSLGTIKDWFETMFVYPFEALFAPPFALNFYLTVVLRSIFAAPLTCIGTLVMFLYTLVICVPVGIFLCLWCIKIEMSTVRGGSGTAPV